VTICFPATLFLRAITPTKIGTLGVLCVILEPSRVFFFVCPTKGASFVASVGCGLSWTLDSDSVVRSEDPLCPISSSSSSSSSDILCECERQTDGQTENRISWGDFLGLLESYSYSSSSGVWVSLLWACMMRFWIFLQEWW
jgi:hypothetical protein